MHLKCAGSHARDVICRHVILGSQLVSEGRTGIFDDGQTTGNVTLVPEGSRQGSLTSTVTRLTLDHSLNGIFDSQATKTAADIHKLLNNKDATG